MKLLLKEVLNAQDYNYHTPLHISSYFGDFKQSRLFTLKGADSSSAANSEPPLNVGKDKFSRGVLQNLNDAATTSNVPDLEYLVNCGEKIDERSTIAGQAPIHKAVLSSNSEMQKQFTLDTIFNQNADINILDSNGWTALHHASHRGDLVSVNTLIRYGANLNAISNQFKTPLHLASLNNHFEVVQALLESGANLDA